MKMKPIRTAILTCVFALSLSAFAQSPAAGQPAAPQAAQPSQTQPQAVQPSQPAPQQTQPAPATTSSPLPSIDDQVKVLAQELNLNADQQGKIKSVLVDQREQASTVVADNSLSRDDKVQKIHTLREATIAKVRSVLNDDQKKKLDQMLEGPAPNAQPKEPPK